MNMRKIKSVCKFRLSREDLIVMMAMPGYIEKLCLRRMQRWPSRAAAISETVVNGFAEFTVTVNDSFVSRNEMIYHLAKSILKSRGGHNGVLRKNKSRKSSEGSPEKTRDRRRSVQAD